MVKRFVDVQNYLFRISILISGIIGDNLLCHQRIQKLNDYIDTIGFICMNVVQPDRYLIILQIPVVNFLLQGFRIIHHKR
ncbi:hypothetical protein D3C76_1307230 [compost metagenome]